MPHTDIPHDPHRFRIQLGCAGWNIRRDHADCFEPSGSHLQRYASTFNAVEINSCFYRPHRLATYERWSASVPEDFRFAVKLPKAITHEARLVGASANVEKFLLEVSGLGSKLGPILIQLPPSFMFDPGVVVPFLSDFRRKFEGQVVLEPRHETWFTEDVDAMLAEQRVGRVAADPARVPVAATPGGYDRVIYYRLHGSPRIYYSAYPADYLTEVASVLERYTNQGAAVWCIFDNTALGAATRDALTVKSLLGATLPNA
jgi:uncharacterized protein YecE (DUF72 family)